MVPLISEMEEIISKSGFRGSGVCDDERGKSELEFLFRQVRGWRLVGLVVVEVRVGVEIRLVVGVGTDSLSGGPRSFV